MIVLPRRPVSRAVASRNFRGNARGTRMEKGGCLAARFWGTYALGLQFRVLPRTTGALYDGR